jgi:L-ascorbate oxidase
MGNRSEVLSLPYPQVQNYLDFGGSVNGNSTHPPEVVEYFELPIWADGDGQ